MMHPKDQRGVTTFWGISVILMEVVVVLFVFYILYFFWIENPTPTDDIVIVKLFRRSGVSIQPQAGPVEWQTYQNITYSIALRYPAGYTVKEGPIDYNAVAGHVFSLMSGDREQFWLRIFPRLPSDDDIATAYQRLTNINPSVYQTYKQRVSGGEAIAYRVAPGQAPQDHVYFMSSDYFFEAPMDAQSAQILGTLLFIK